MLKVWCKFWVLLIWLLIKRLICWFWLILLLMILWWHVNIIAHQLPHKTLYWDVTFFFFRHFVNKFLFYFFDYLIKKENTIWDSIWNLNGCLILNSMMNHEIFLDLITGISIFTSGEKSEIITNQQICFLNVILSYQFKVTDFSSFYYLKGGFIF